MEWYHWLLVFVASVTVFDAVCIIMFLRTHKNHGDDSTI